MLSDCAKPLNRDPSPFQPQVDIRGRNLGRVDEAPAGRANLIKGNAAHLTGQTHGPTDLIPDPGHANFVGPHVRPEDVVCFRAQRARECPNQWLLALPRHLRIAKQHGLATTMGEPCRGILERHRARQSRALLQ